MEFWKSQQGMSILEVLVSVAVLGLVGGAVFTLLGSSVVEQKYAEQTQTGWQLVQEGLNAVRQMRNVDFSVLSVGTHGLMFDSDTWVFSGSSDTTDDLFERTVTITSIDDNQVEATITVSWTARGSRSPVASASTRFSNWQNVVPVGP